MAEAICLAAICGALWLSYRRFGDMFTPLAVYVTVWCGALLLFSIRLINYIELSDRTSMLIASSIVAYVAGCLLCPKLKPSSPAGTEFHLDRFHHILKALMVVHFCAFVIFVLQMQSRFGISIYLTDPSQIRAEADDWMKTGVLAIPLLLHYPILILNYFDVLLNHRLRWYNAVGFIVPVIQELMWTGRGTLVLFIITVFFMWIYFRAWRTVNRPLIVSGIAALAVAVAGFLALGSVYGKLISEETGTYNISDFNVESSAALLLAYPYMYVTSPLPTFQEAMADVHDHSGGVRTFYPAARVMQAFGVLDALPQFAVFDNYFVPVPNNTYTYLFTYYQDFGSTGVVVVPFILGFVHTYLYWRMRSSPSLWTMAAVAISMGTICFSVFTCLPSTVMIWEAYGVVYAVWSYSKQSSHAVATALDNTRTAY